MVRLRLAGILLLVTALCASSVVTAQTKDAGSKMPKKAAALKPLDINTASEDEIASVGIDRAVAKKIIQGRPYRNKTELVSRQLLSREQYDKVKDSLVARQPKGK